MNSLTFLSSAVAVDYIFIANEGISSAKNEDVDFARVKVYISANVRERKKEEKPITLNPLIT